MKKKKVLCVLLAVALSLLFTACSMSGSSDDETSDSEYATSCYPTESTEIQETKNNINFELEFVDANEELSSDTSLYTSSCYFTDQGATACINVGNVVETGSNEDFYYQVRDTGCVELTNYKGSGEIVYIPEEIEGYPVSLIGKNCFNSNQLINEIVIPETVEAIGEGAFTCSSLTKINIPKSVKMIFANAFYDCPNLATVEISDGLTAIDENAFSKCNSLVSLEIPGSVKYIPSSFLDDCKNLTTLKLNEGLEDFYGLTDCPNLQDFTIPSTVKHFKGIARCSSVKNVVIPNSFIDDECPVFAGCTSLEYVELPDSITGMTEKIFSDCVSLKELHIPANCTFFSYKVFNNCKSLENIYFSAEDETNISFMYDTFSLNDHIITLHSESKSYIYKYCLLQPLLKWSAE